MSESGVAAFDVDVDSDSATAFATLSGDWNPLHSDAAYAAATPYRRQVLHGAFSAGLVSRMAGMYLPGTDCLLHGMRLRFLAPIVLPARLHVEGRRTGGHGEVGRVDVTITDRDHGARYVEASYEFGTHVAPTESRPAAVPRTAPAAGAPVVLVTGATGGIGAALLDALGGAGIGLTRGAAPGMIHVDALEDLPAQLGERPIDAIVHLAWPAPDNTGLLHLHDVATAVDHHVASPLRQMLALAQLLARQGTPDAALLLVGSTAATPGRHNYRMPLYSLGKALVPEVARVLAVELGPSGRRCMSVVFDVVEAGMNLRLSRAARAAHAARAPTARIANAADAAEQLKWVLSNRSFLASGASIQLTGGALP